MHFNNWMAGRRETDGKTDWLDFHPVKAHLLQGSDTAIAEDGSKTVFFVDIGGNEGHDVTKFVAKYHGTGLIRGRFILQDRQETISRVAKNKEFAQTCEPMVHDFFGPQPFKGKLP